MKIRSNAMPLIPPPPSPRPPRLIGVTMRLLRQQSTGDMHDALSGDWGRFLAAAGLTWLPLPNCGAETAALARALNLGGCIFSGGGSVGEEPARDVTEGLLLQWAREKGLPVLGVCRGFQSLQWHLGGELENVRGHVATRHALWAADSPYNSDWHWRREVNSYHALGIGRLSAPLEPLALSREEGQTHVEAAWAPGLLGLMWHPEREAVPAMEDVELIRHFFADPCARPLCWR